MNFFRDEKHPRCTSQSSFSEQQMNKAGLLYIGNKYFKKCPQTSFPSVVHIYIFVPTCPKTLQARTAFYSIPLFHIPLFHYFVQVSDPRPRNEMEALGLVWFGPPFPPKGSKKSENPVAIPVEIALPKEPKEDL